MPSVEQGLMRLEEKRGQLANNIFTLEKELKEELQTNGKAHATDPADMPASHYAGTHPRLELLGQLGRALDKVCRVIASIENGEISDEEYGFCETCGEEIPDLRLAEFPESTLCVDCKSKEEKKKKSLPRGFKVTRKPQYTQGMHAH